MKRIICIMAALLVVNSCSDEEKITAPDLCFPTFHAESLQVEVRHIYLPFLNRWVWDVAATYNYMLEGCRGKIHTHEFVFSEIGETLVNQDNTIADCFEPINVQLEKSVSVLTFNDIFQSYDSVTVYFRLQGLFQRCGRGSADSVAAISWCDTVRAEVVN